MPDMRPVNSSNIAKIGYDVRDQELHVEFTNGARHAYQGVAPSDYAALAGAESVGKHFHAAIRNGGFQSRKVES